MSELVQDKESSVSTSIALNETAGETPSELNHSRTFMDGRSEQDLLFGIKKEAEAGKLPANVAS
ncbi:unnamed protein product [Arabidopsis arenosa]|uniref:Glycerol-3-phosphate O-acyltransferase alpha-helical bundle N-terminal domain-containing protein n=1 Tax=Arabidopsis arenosa TaxID=38785 RepID=A0A8S2A094_ARAAE|nr:unnamed protein product [Arabidopsis arenosa]